MPPLPDETELRELRARLTRAVAKTCPSWLAADAEDIVQEATIKLLGAKSGSQELAGRYLYRTAYSAVVDEMRRRMRRPESPAEALEQTASSAAADPERRSQARQIGRGITECLDELAPPRRAAVTLQLQGHSVPDLARRLGWTTKKGEHLVYRGLATLRECLRRKGHTP